MLQISIINIFFKYINYNIEYLVNYVYSLSYNLYNIIYYTKYINTRLININV